MEGRANGPGGQLPSSPKAQPPPSPFVVGAGRSGTTMLRLMLDAHPELSIPPETHFIPAAARVWKQSRDVTRCLQTIVASERWGDLGLEANDFDRLVSEAPRLNLRQLLRAIYAAYASRHGKIRWGDKSPGCVLQMPLIARLLPEARFIHLIRDGRDVALSVLPLWFGPDSIEDAARWWAERVRAGRRDGATVPYHEVLYEQLVERPRGQLRRVCNFIDLEFEEQQLSYHLHAAQRMSEMKDVGDRRGLTTAEERAAMRARLRAKLSQAPHPREIGRWRTEMTRAQVRAFEAIAGDLLEELGYSLSRATAPTRPRTGAP